MPHEGPRYPKIASRHFASDGLLRPEDVCIIAHKIPQEGPPKGPNTAPRAPKSAPKPSQYDPIDVFSCLGEAALIGAVFCSMTYNLAQKVCQGPQEGPKRDPTAPKFDPGGPRDGFKKPPRGSPDERSAKAFYG